MIELYKRIWKVTGRSQFLLIALSLIVAALAAVPLQFQKDIVNGLDRGMTVRILVLLCAAYFAVLVLSNALKFTLTYLSSTLGESVIRHVRKVIFEEHRTRTRENADNRLESGPLATMVAAEAEEIGRFAGGAIAHPLLQFGTLFSVVFFIAATQPFLGLFLVCVILPQAIIVMSVQRAINRRIGERVRFLRKATDEITADDIEKARQSILENFDRIFETRRRIYLFKFSTKFALNVITGLGVVGILLIGGLLLFEGRTDIGTVVASLSALERISDPWRQLITFYRELSAVRVKFEILAAT